MWDQGHAISDVQLAAMLRFMEEHGEQHPVNFESADFAKRDLILLWLVAHNAAERYRGCMEANDFFMQFGAPGLELVKMATYARMKAMAGPPTKRAVEQASEVASGRWHTLAGQGLRHGP